MELNVGDKVKLVHGENIYQVSKTDGVYIEMICIDFKQYEQIIYDVGVYSYNSIFWVCKNDLHLFNKQGN